MALSSGEYRTLLDILDALYAQSDQIAIFRTVSGKLKDFLDASTAIFIDSDEETGRILFGNHDIFGNDESAMLACLARYAALNPFFLTGRFLCHLNDSNGNMDPLPEKDFPGGEFISGYPIPEIGALHVLGSALGKQGDLLGIFAIYRRKEDRVVSEREREIFNIVLPHMARALCHLDRMPEVERKELVGFIAVDEDGSSYFMNETARSVLGETPPSALPDSSQSASPALFRSKKGVFRVRSVSAGRERKGGFIFLETCQTDRKIRLALEKFRLRRREKEVASLAAQGFSNREIAKALFLSEQTVKDYLHDVYGKLGIRRRSELAAMAIGLD